MTKTEQMLIDEICILRYALREAIEVVNKHNEICPQDECHFYKGDCDECVFNYLIHKAKQVVVGSKDE